MLKILRFNYHLIWDQQNPNAYINFLQVLTEDEFLPFIISKQNEDPHYRDPKSFSTHYFELINHNDDFIIENSETSDKRPDTTSSIFSETAFEVYNQDNNTQFFQNEEPQQHFLTGSTTRHK